MEPIPERPEKKQNNPQKKVDFDVNFNSVNAEPYQGSSQSSPFDNFQSTPALQKGKSSAFEDFDNFGNNPQTQQNAFDNFGTAPARSSNLQENPFGTFEQPETGVQANDPFAQFNSAEQQNNDFDTFNNFEQGPKEKRSSNRPQDVSLEEQKGSPQEDFGGRNQQNNNVAQTHEEPFSGRIQIEVPEALRGKRHIKKEEEEEKVPQNDGVGFDDFDDFNFDEQANEQSGFNFEYNEGRGKSGTPHSAQSKDMFADVEPESQRQNEQERINHVHAESPQTGKFGEQGGNAFSESKKPPLRSSIQNAYDVYNQRETQKQYPGEDWTIPSAQKEMNNRSSGGAFESPFRGQNQSTLSASQLIARSSVGAKFGDMESERIRMERDRILAELENVKRLYNGMKIEYDYMKRNNETTETDYTKLKQELEQLRRKKGQLSLNNDYLKSENDAFKKFRGTLTQENEGHVRLFEDMSKELTYLKEKINDYEITDQRQRSNLRISDLETTLKNTQVKIDSMYNLHRTIHTEFNHTNAELDRLRQGSLIESRINFSPPRQDLLGSNLGRPVDISKSYVSPLREKSKSPSRERSRSPQIVDLLSLERPNEPSELGRYVPNDRLSLRSQDAGSNLLNQGTGGLNFDLSSKLNAASQIYQPYRSSIGGVEGKYGLSSVDFTGTANSENRHTNQLLTLDRSLSPSQRNYETTAPVVVNNYVSTINTTQTPFSNLLGFVPKYSNLSPLEVPETRFSPRKSENPHRLSFHSSLPQKYLSQDLGTLNSEQKVATFQSENGALLGERQEIGRTSVSYTSSTLKSQNLATSNAAALLEKAKKLREQTSKSFVGEKVEDTYTRRSVVDRTSVTGTHRNEIIIQNQDFMVPPPGRESFKASMEQNGQVGRRISPERERLSAEGVHLGQERIHQHISNYPTTIPSQIDFSLPERQEYNSNARGPNHLATSTMNFESQVGYLPEGFYQGSPVRERVINRSEMVELKPTETLRIVERVVRKSPQRRNKSPTQGYKSRHSSAHKNRFESSNYNPSLAHTLKNDLEIIKRNFEDGDLDYNITRKIERGRSRSPQQIGDEKVSSYGVSKGYSQNGYKVNPLVESIRNELEALKTAPTTGSGLKLGPGMYEERRELENGYSKEISLFGESATEKSKKFHERKSSSSYLNSGYTGAPGIKLAVEDTYFSSSASKGR